MKQERKAGANLTSRDGRGKHRNSSSFREGDNWLECQRCGLDTLASEARMDGYEGGLLVCSQCYDPPHPSDFPYVPGDRVAPQGLQSGDASVFDRTGAVGSTTVPGSTFSDPDPDAL